MKAYGLGQMGMNIQEDFAITPNGKVAILKYIGEISPQIQKAFSNNENLMHFSHCGYFSSGFGDLVYSLIVLDTQENFNRPNVVPSSSLFIQDPTNFIEDNTDNFYREWLATLRNQDILQLALTIECIDAKRSLVNSSIIFHGNGLTKYISYLDKSITSWRVGNNYTKAAEFVPLEKVRAEMSYIVLAAQTQLQDNEKKLLVCFLYSCSSYLLPSDQLGQWNKSGEGRKMIENLLKNRFDQITASNDWHSLSEIADNEQENLIRDWLFTRRCLDQFKKNFAVAIGLTDSGSWAWRKIPSGSDLANIWGISRVYRSLLFTRHWQNLVKEKDVPVPYLDLNTIAFLGKVPNRKAISETGKILKNAITHKRYGITAGTTIIVGKEGFESISIESLGPDSRHCIFKIIVKIDHTGRNLCLFGKLDAALGTIEPLGIKHTPGTDKPLSLLLFSAAIAYHDCIVAREALQSDGVQTKKGNVNKKRKSSRYQTQPPLLARLKTSSKQMSDQFADPNEFLTQLKKQCPTFRVEHIRNLPDGHKASDKQKELAKVYEIFVPEGFTFISPSGSGDISESQEHQYRSLSLMKLFFN